MNFMDRTRASSLESSKRSTEKYEPFTLTDNQNNTAQDRRHPLICSQRELSDDNSSSENYYQGEYNKILNAGGYDEIGSTCPTTNISEALKHEYCQMMYALNELKNILSTKRKVTETNSSCSQNDSHINKLQREIYYRDSLIKCLSDRLKVLCRANDKLISDYENQERILSNELVCLKRQLEKTKDAMCALAMIKRYPNIQTNQGIENEIYYLRELLCSKEITIADLKHRIERLNHENNDLKCEIENKSGTNSHSYSNQFDRDASYLKHLSEQMKAQINTLTDSLEFKNCIVTDLQTQLECHGQGDFSRNLREELKIVIEENRSHKCEIIKQAELLDDLKNQLRILTENSIFKDETIVEMKRCLRRFTDNYVAMAPNDNCRDIDNNNLVTLLNSIKNYLCHQNSDLLDLLDSDSDAYHILETFILKLTDLVNQPKSNCNDIEFFKEFLSNEINLKNDLGIFLSNNIIWEIDSIEKFQNQMNYLLSIDMDDGFRNCPREYLHQCYLSDDNLRLIIENLVKNINNVPVKSITEINTENKSCVEMVNRGTFASSLDELHGCCNQNLKLVESELELERTTNCRDKECLTKELAKSLEEKKDLEKQIKVLLDETCNSCAKLKNLESVKNTEIEKLCTEVDSMKQLKSQNCNFQEIIKQLESKLCETSNDKKCCLDNKNLEIVDLQRKLSEEMMNSTKIKLLHCEICVSNEQLKDENQCLLGKLKECLDKKTNLEKKFEELKLRLTQEETCKSDQCNLKMEIKSLEMKNYSLISEKSILECQTKKLKNQLEELSRRYSADYADLTICNKNSEESDGCKQKVDDIEGILGLMTGQLNEKVQSIAEIRRMIKCQSPLKPCDELGYEKTDEYCFTQQLLSQKESEISYLKSKLDCIQMHNCPDDFRSKTQSYDDSDATLNETVFELKSRVNQLNQELNDRSNFVAHLQHLLKEKDIVIENASKTIKVKNASLIETDRLMHLMSLQNSNIKDELSASYNGKGELHMLKSSNNNFRDEIVRLQRDNERLKENLRDNMKSDNSKRHKSQSFDLLPQRQPPVSLSDNSVELINKEIKKLYVNFEDKNNELKEFSLKEIKNRDRKLEDLNFEVKLKTDQVQNVLADNIRLSDRFEDESQRSCKFQQELLIKEEMLEKLLKEKENIRSTLLSELRGKNQDLEEKSKTVYFLNAEVHRLSSSLDILNAELQTTRNSSVLLSTQSKTLAISEAQLCTLKEENSSLKFCINLKMSEMELINHELTANQVGTKQLISCIDELKSKLSERDVSLSKQIEENGALQLKLSNVEIESKAMIECLRKQLKDIKSDYEKMSDTKIKLDAAVSDLNEENCSSKEVIEKLESEKFNYRDEINNLLKKIDSLTISLSESKEYITKILDQFEKEQQQNRRLSDIIETNQLYEQEKNTELHQTLIQLEDLSNENRDLKNEMQRLHAVIMHLEDRVKSHSERDKVKLLQIDNKKMDKELERFQHLEKEMNESIRRKSTDCDILSKEYQELLKMVEKYQQRIESIEKNEMTAQQLLNEEASKCHQLQSNFDKVTQELLILEEKWSNCNSIWIEKYNQLNDKFEKLEHDYFEQKELYFITQHDQQSLETALSDQCRELNCLSNRNKKLSDECTRLSDNGEMMRLRSEYKTLKNSNADLSSQVDELTSELLSAHMPNVTPNKSALNDLYSKVKHKLSSDRRYRSQPVLNDMNDYLTDPRNDEQKNLVCLQSRYKELCEQMDDMTSQLEKKDMRIMVLENCNENNTFGSYECEQNNCVDTSPNYCYDNNEHLAIQKHEIQVIQACTNELQETILSQNQELDQLKNSYQMLLNDYRMCCEKVVDLESQIMMNEEQFNNLREEDENMVCIMDERNQLKEELINVNSRLTDEINHNSNLEQQVLTYRQKVNNHTTDNEELRKQLNHVKCCYENAMEQCRRANVDAKDTKAVNDQTINCLNAKIKALQNDLNTLHNKFNLPCERCIHLQEQLNTELICKVDLEDLYHKQCLNTEQLSAQLFDNRSLIEQLTDENRRLSSLVDVNQSKINQLLNRVDQSDECLQDKNNEVRESKRNVEILEKNLTETEIERRNLLNHVISMTEKIESRPNDDGNDLKNELVDCYSLIERMKSERSHLCLDNERMSDALSNKEQLLRDYSSTINVSGEEIEKLKSEINRRTSVSITELNILKNASDKLAEDLSCLQNKISATYQSAETQTYVVNNDFPVIKLDSVRSSKEHQDRSQVSDVTYTSSKSVSWRSTHTDKRPATDDAVLALQQAIDDYNGLVSGSDICKGAITSTETQSTKLNIQSPTMKSVSSHYSVINEKTVFTRPKTQLADVIFVEVDAEVPGKASTSQTGLMESVVEVASVHDIENGRGADLMEFLKNSNIHFDEGIENPDVYLGRVLDKYKELEEFFFASMKIQFKQSFTDDTAELFENFSDRIDSNMGILKEQCQHLNAILASNTSELNVDVREVAAEHLTTKDIKTLIDIVITQQKQMCALNIIFKQSQQAQPIHDTSTAKANTCHLSKPYETVWQTHDVCDPDIQLGTLAVSQLSISKKRIELSELNLPESLMPDIKDDTHVNSLSTNVVSNEMQPISYKGATELYVAERITGNINDDSCSHKSARDSKSKETRGIKSHVSEQSKTLHTSELMEAKTHNDSYSHIIPNKDNIETSVEVNSAVLNAKENTMRKSSAKKFRSPESTTHSIHHDVIEGIVSRDTLDDSLLALNSTKQLNSKEGAHSQFAELRTSESRIGSFKQDSISKRRHSREARSNSARRSIQGEVTTNMCTHMEKILNNEYHERSETSLKNIQSTVFLPSLNTVNSDKKVEVIDDTLVINLAVEEKENSIFEFAQLEPDFSIKAQSLPLNVVDENDKHDGQIHLQNITEGVHLKEGKTKNINTLEDSLSYASIGHFEKAMHQLNEIDFDNLDPSIDIKNRIRIYSGEIDYLNEKNLFLTYAVNVLSDPTRYLYNNSFLEHVDTSLTSKAEHLRLLQCQFNFELHVSEKEKTLMAKVLDTDFTYKKLFDNWIELQKNIQTPKVYVEQLNELKEQLEQCKTANVKDLIQADQISKTIRLEKDALMLQMKKISEENESLKSKTTVNTDVLSKSDVQSAIVNSSKQSKIPLLKTPSTEQQLSNVSKPVSNSPRPSIDKFPQTQSQKSIISGDQLVSPDEVRLAIAGETNIENLRRFAFLLAEDNFDLAAEIEKLLATIEELRRQLKENCDILSETVEMLQNSEKFVNDLEKKLSAETKKTQIISNRIDQLNDLNKEVIMELQRILKNKAPPISQDMDVQGRCNYLLECLKTLELENRRLEDASHGIRTNITDCKNEDGFNFLSADLSGGIEFEFETIMQPNGSVSGTLTLTYANDISKTMSLTFDIHSAKDISCLTHVPEGPRVTRFIFDREPHPAVNVKQSDDDPSLQFINYNNNENLNNNCCHDTDLSCNHSQISSSQHTSFHNTTFLPIESLCGDTVKSNDICDQFPINRTDYYYCSFSYISQQTEVMESRSCTSDNTVSSTEETVSDNSISLPMSQTISDNLSSSSQSLTNGSGQKNYFINYRKPIYFRKLRDSF